MTEAKKQEFRNYLEKGGVIDSLTKALIGLYEEQEKPNDPLEFVKSTLAANDKPQATGNSAANSAEMERIQKENSELKIEVERLNRLIDELNDKQDEHVLSGESKAKEEKVEDEDEMHDVPT